MEHHISREYFRRNTVYVATLGTVAAACEAVFWWIRLPPYTPFGGCMENVIGSLYVGDDSDYLKIKGKDGWSVLRCCKEGPGGHRDTLGYESLGAPKGAHYLSVDQPGRRALNFIDPQDPHFIPKEMVERGLEFIDKRLAAGDKVLVACNAGHSRGPTTAMLYLRAIGELAGNFIHSEKIYRTLYAKYDPGIGVRQFAKTHWDYFAEKLRKA